MSALPSFASGVPLLSLSGALREERERRDCERSLMSFISNPKFWELIEPDLPFCDNWHLHDIAYHLEAVSRGEIKTLLVNIPPGTMKSILISVGWPAWEWSTNPHLRYLGASYSPDLSVRDSMRCHDVITSDWYQRHWPEVQLKRGSDQKTKYELTAGGWRIATSVAGRGTGEHPDRKIVDDPHNAKQAESDAERIQALDWYDRTLSSRGKSRGARTVVVMQRLHEKDLSGHILEKNPDVVHLCIPMEYEGVKRRNFLGWEDPRKEKGELLWPALFDKQSVKELKLELGEYGASGQLQQRPSPMGGGRLKPGNFKLWPNTKPFPVIEFLIQSYDTAFTEKTDNDPTACTTWGIFRHEGIYNIMLGDAWDDWLEYPELRQRVISDWGARYFGSRMDPANKPRPVDLVIVEQKGSGQSLLQDMKMAKIQAFPYNPGNSDKVARAAVVAPILDAGLVWVPESKVGGTWASWADAFMQQLARFPKDEHDDYVDTFTQVLRYARDSGFLNLKASLRDDDLPKPEEKETTNPYLN